jgi:aspartate racemase
MIGPPKHIGIVACSAEGAALCYRAICLMAAECMGEHNHPPVTLSSLPLAEYKQHLDRGNWEGVGEMLLESARRVAGAGAEFAICPDNTCHQAFAYVTPKSPIPWLHIAEAVADEAARKGFRKLLVLGTLSLMESSVYPEALKERGIAWEIPETADRFRIDSIIYKELINGIRSEASRDYFHTLIEAAKPRGCDAAVLGCTEIPLLLHSGEAPLPTLSSTHLLAAAALQRALK